MKIKKTNKGIKITGTKSKKIVSGNLLIAEFMGFNKNRAKKVDPKTWSYDWSWNSLHRVIDRIEAIDEDKETSNRNYHFYIGKRSVRVIYDYAKYSTSLEDIKDVNDWDKTCRDYRYVIWGTKIESTWVAVVDFIKWFNKQNKKK